MLDRLSSDWDRELLVDPTGSFEPGKIGKVTRNFEETVNALSSVYLDKPFRIIAQYNNDAEYAKLFASLRRLLEQTRGKAKPWLLGIDEVDFFSSPNDIDENLEWLLKYGRHSAMSWAVACRADVETHRAVRMNANCILFRQGMLSPEMKRKIKDAEIVRETELPPVGRLKMHGPKEPELASEGTHYICVPDDFDTMHARWVELASAA
jgi:hypothetical protein